MWSCLRCMDFHCIVSRSFRNGESDFFAQLHETWVAVIWLKKRMGDGIPGHERLAYGIGAVQPLEKLPGVAPARVDECDLAWKIVALCRDQFVESRVGRGLIASGMLRQCHIDFAPDSLRLQFRFVQRDIGLPPGRSEP